MLALNGADQLNGPRQWGSLLFCLVIVLSLQRAEGSTEETGSSYTKIRILPGKLIHAILDNYAAHKHPKVRAWLARHPRWTFHFTPTSCSWANAVETFFATLTRRRLRRGVFRSLVDLQATINQSTNQPIPRRAQPQTQ